MQVVRRGERDVERNIHVKDIDVGAAKRNYVQQPCSDVNVRVCCDVIYVDAQGVLLAIDPGDLSLCERLHWRECDLLDVNRVEPRRDVLVKRERLVARPNDSRSDGDHELGDVVKR